MSEVLDWKKLIKRAAGPPPSVAKAEGKGDLTDPIMGDVSLGRGKGVSGAAEAVGLGEGHPAGPGVPGTLKGPGSPVVGKGPPTPSAVSAAPSDPNMINRLLAALYGAGDRVGGLRQQLADSSAAPITSANWYKHPYTLGPALGAGGLAGLYGAYNWMRRRRRGEDKEASDRSFASRLAVAVAATARG